MAACAILLTGCKDSKEEIVERAKSHLEKSLSPSGELQILATSQPDSAFGSYYPQKDIQGITKIMAQVTNVIMKRTDNMTKFNPDDSYVLSLAGRQMEAGTAMMSKDIQCDKKEPWSGWRVKIDYKFKEKGGAEYKAEKWYTFDKEGKNITDSLELPLP